MITTIAILATVAALVSALMALISWLFHREIAKPAISLTKVDVKGERKSQIKLILHMTFYFKNVGKRETKIKEFRIGQMNLQADKFEQRIFKPMANPLYPEATFNYKASFSKAIAPDIPNQALSRILPQIVGKTAIIIALKEKRKWTRYYTVYHGTAGVSQANEQDYRNIEDKLPKEFKADI